MSFWCFTCNSLVFLPCYTQVLGSLRNFIGVPSGFSFYLCTVTAISFRNILSTLEAHHVKTKYPVFLLTLSSSFFCCCFPVITFVICTCSLTISSLSQLQTRAHYLFAFHNAQEATMNLAMSYIFLKFFQIIEAIILPFNLFTI